MFVLWSLLSTTTRLFFLFKSPIFLCHTGPVTCVCVCVCVCVFLKILFRCRNISALQECLSKIMLVREKDLDTARQYFELLLLNDEVCPWLPSSSPPVFCIISDFSFAFVRRFIRT